MLSLVYSSFSCSPNACYSADTLLLYCLHTFQKTIMNSCFLYISTVRMFSVVFNLPVSLREGVKNIVWTLWLSNVKISNGICCIIRQLHQIINPCNDLEKEIVSQSLAPYNTLAKNVVLVTERHDQRQLQSFIGKPAKIAKQNCWIFFSPHCNWVWKIFWQITS